MKKFIILILLISICFSQDLGSIFSNRTEKNDNGIQINQNFNLTDLENLTYTPVERPINPGTYILGPGDLLGISIMSATNVSLPLRVNPIGELLIPSVGIIKVDGISLINARKLIDEYIKQNAIQNAITNVTLLDVRRFKVQILGAVNNPGYVYISAIDGVYEALQQGGGVQKFAHSEIVQIIRENETIDIYLKKYLSGVDNTQNVQINSGDIIYVPFNEYAKSMEIDDISYNENQVTVFGFVSKSSNGNVFRYFQGYTVRDYIALVGGTIGANSSFPIGNMKKAKIYRSDGTIINSALEEIVLPGDIIEVPPKLMSQIVGNDGLIRTLASVISSAYLVYRYIQDQK